MEQVTTNIVVVFVTVPDEMCGTVIAQAVVSKRLAACVKIVPNLTSIYTWKNGSGDPVIEESSEQQLIIKTVVTALPALEKAVLELHPYEVPEFVAVRAEYVSRKYSEWVATSVNGTVNSSVSG